jgi:hypothetical protein
VSEINVAQPPVSEGCATVMRWDICSATPASPRPTVHGGYDRQNAWGQPGLDLPPSHSSRRLNHLLAELVRCPVALESIPASRTRAATCRSGRRSRRWGRWFDRLDAVDRAGLALIGPAGRDHLAIGRDQVERNLPVEPFLSTNWPPCALPGVERACSRPYPTALRGNLQCRLRRLTSMQIRPVIVPR